jgi:predicted PurR-regulated permease PerM
VCWTYIPNNTAPDGTISKAVQGLTTLSNELAENSGINDPFTDLMKKWFGRWKGWMTSVFTSLMVVAGVLILVGCCILPSVRGLIQRVIETALTKQSLLPYQNNLFLLEMQEYENQWLLNEFEEKNLK